MREKSEGISRRKVLSFLGVSAAVGFALPAEILLAPEADAQAPANSQSPSGPQTPANDQSPSGPQSGTARRQERRTRRTERRQERRTRRTKRRQERRTGREERREERRSGREERRQERQAPPQQ